MVSVVGSANSVAGREAEDALIALGYKPNQAAEAVHRAQTTGRHPGRHRTTRNLGTASHGEGELWRLSRIDLSRVLKIAVMLV